MTKKAAKKAKQQRNGDDPNALGLEGAGVEIVRIEEVTEAIEAYEKIKNARCKLTPKEVEAKTKVVALMEQHEEQLRNKTTGNLEYHLDDNRYVVIEPAKVKIKFRDEKPEKAKKAAMEPGPEGQMPEDDEQD